MEISPLHPLLFLNLHCLQTIWLCLSTSDLSFVWEGSSGKALLFSQFCLVCGVVFLSWIVLTLSTIRDSVCSSAVHRLSPITHPTPASALGKLFLWRRIFFHKKSSPFLQLCIHCLFSTGLSQWSFMARMTSHLVYSWSDIVSGETK